MPPMTFFLFCCFCYIALPDTHRQQKTPPAHTDGVSIKIALKRRLQNFPVDRDNVFFAH